MVGAVSLGPFPDLSQLVRGGLTDGLGGPLAGLPMPCPGSGRGLPGECIGQPGTEKPGRAMGLATAGSGHLTGRSLAPSVLAVQMRPLTVIGNSV